METSTENNQQQPSNEKLSKKGLLIFCFIQCVLLVIYAMDLLTSGSYGWTLFTVIPFSIGLTVGVFTNTFQSKSLLKGFSVVMLVVLVFSLLLLVCGFEGAICILMALGMICLPAALGLLVGYRIRNIHKTFMLVFIVVLNSSATVYDKVDTSKVSSTAVESLIINASKERVWEVLTHPVDFSLNDNFFFKAGVSYPKSMKIEYDKEQHCFLCCNFNNGFTRLKIDRIDSLKSIHFSFQEPIAPMKELTFYSSIDAPHLNEGYFMPSYGEFAIEPINSNQCKIIATTAYSYKITPVFYWKLWADYLVNKMHSSVLKDIKKIAGG